MCVERSPYIRIFIEWATIHSSDYSFFSVGFIRNSSDHMCTVAHRGGGAEKGVLPPPEPLPAYTPLPPLLNPSLNNKPAPWAVCSLYFLNSLKFYFRGRGRAIDKAYIDRQWTPFHNEGIVIRLCQFFLDLGFEIIYFQGTIKYFYSNCGFTKCRELMSAYFEQSRTFSNYHLKI